MLTIVKSRGTGHSRQAREIILSDQGVTLSNVYSASGEVLMGTLRWQKEEMQQRERAHAERNLLRKQRELAHAETDVEQRVEALNRELELRRAEIDDLAEEIKLDKLQRDAASTELERLRGVDRNNDGAA